MKKTIAFLLAVLISVSLTACGKDSKADANVNNTITNLQETSADAEPTENPYRDSDKAITTPLDTDYFSLSFPDEWCADCCYEINDNAFGTTGYTIQFKMNRNYCGNYDGWLFSLCVTDDYSTFYERYDNYVGLITVGEDRQLYLIAEYPTETQVDSAYNELYEELRCDIPQILSGIWLTNSNSDYTPATKDIAENQVKEKDIPYISAWTDKLDVSFAPSVGYMDVTNTCLSSDGTSSGMGVGTIYGAYALPDIHYYWLDDGHPYRYYGVQDGIVVAYLDDVSAYNHSAHYYVGEEFDSIPPKTVNVDNRCYFEWELDNGYLVLETVRNNYSSPYTEWWVQKVMYFKSRDMCFFLSPGITEWAKEQNAQAAAEKAEIEEKKNLSEAEQDALLMEMCRLGTYASSSSNGYEIAFLSVDRSTITLNIRNKDVIDKTVNLTVNDLRYYLDTDYAPYFIVEATDSSEVYEFTIQADGFQATGFSFILDIDYSFCMVDYYEY